MTINNMIVKHTRKHFEENLVRIFFLFQRKTTFAGGGCLENGPFEDVFPIENWMIFRQQLVKTSLSLPTFFFQNSGLLFIEVPGIDVLIFFFGVGREVFTSIVGRGVRLFEGKATKPMKKPIPLFPPDSKSKLQKTRGKKEAHFTTKKSGHF